MVVLVVLLLPSLSWCNCCINSATVQGGWRARLGPFHWVGAHRWEKTGSVTTVHPFTWISSDECPNHVIWILFCGGFRTCCQFTGSTGKCSSNQDWDGGVNCKNLGKTWPMKWMPSFRFEWFSCGCPSTNQASRSWTRCWTSCAISCLVRGTGSWWW